MNAIQSPSVSPARLALLLAAGEPVDLLDVRTPPEFTNAHVPGARLIPLDDLNDLAVEAYLRERETGKPIFVLCQAGGRAGKAIERFESFGCSDCVLVEGGTQAWMDAGFPVERGAGTVLPLMRQVQIVVGALSVIGAALALLLSPWFALLPLFIGAGLLFAGITGMCGMALMLARMPWNRSHRQCVDLCISQGKQ